MPFANQPTINTAAELDGYAARYKYLCVGFLPGANGPEDWSSMEGDISDTIHNYVRDSAHLGFVFVPADAPELPQIASKFSFGGASEPGGALGFVDGGNTEAGVDLSSGIQMLNGQVSHGNASRNVRLVQHAAPGDLLVVAGMLGSLAETV